MALKGRRREGIDRRRKASAEGTGGSPDLSGASPEVSGGFGGGCSFRMAQALEGLGVTVPAGGNP